MVQLRSPLFQSLIAYEYARLGWGPKLYGLLDCVRIEEYVGSHTLTYDEAYSPEMIQDIAQAYANFHSIQLPVTKKLTDLLGDFIPSIDPMVQKFTDWINSGDLTQQLIDQLHLRQFVSFPYEEEIKWIKKVESKIKQRIVLGTVDCQYLNRLIRKEKNSSTLHGTKTMLIDYDIAGYVNRGFDLAGHFVSQTLTWDGKDTLVSGFSYPSDDERKQFLTHYLNHYKKLLPNDIEDESLDTIENLTLETELHSIGYTILTMLYSRAMFLYFKVQPTRCMHLSMLLSLHRQLKEKFIKKYTNLA